MVHSNYFYFRFNKFEYNFQESWQRLQKENSFCDVTLACENIQVQTHRVILSSYSPVLRNILKICPNSSPFIYLPEVNQRDLKYLLTFMYQGEVYVAGEDLTSFLKLADELNIRGLSEKNNERILSAGETSSKFIRQSTNIHNIQSPMTKTYEENIKIKNDNEPNMFDLLAKSALEKCVATAKNEEKSKEEISAQFIDEINLEIENTKSHDLPYSCDISPNPSMTEYTAPKDKEQTKIEDISYLFNLQNNMASPEAKTNVENIDNTNYLDFSLKSLLTDNEASTFEEPIEIDNITASTSLEGKNLKSYQAESHNLLPKFAMKHTKFVAPTKSEIKLINQSKRMDERLRMRQLQLNSLLGEDHTQIKCQNCGKQFEKINNLIRHIKTIHEGKLYACDKCEYKSSRKDHLKAHKRAFHEGKRFSCNECDYTAATSTQLKQHVQKIHEGKRYLCTQCNKKFKFSKSLQHHVAKALCKVELARKEKRKVELARKEKRKSRLCTHCNKQLKTRSGFKKHIEKRMLYGSCNFQYKCAQCDYKGKTKKEVERHTLSSHIEHPEACDKCDYKAASKQEVIAHKLQNHNVNEKCYACYKCDHRASTREELQLHLSKDHKLRNHACTKCKYKSAKKSNLRRHLMKHQNESN